MSDANPESGSVIDLGGVALPPNGDTGPVPFDYPFTHDSEVFFRGVLDGIINTGGMPRLLFVGRAGYGNRAGLAALGLAKAAAEKKLNVLIVDASFDEPSLSKPFPYQPDEGLSDMILWGSSLQATLRKTQNERIQIVSVGSPPGEPDNILLDHDSDSVLNTLREQAELVLVVSGLHDSKGELSPLVRRSDRTLIVRGEAETVAAINETLPEGKVLEITIGSLAAVEERFEEAALLAAPAAEAARADTNDSDRKTKPIDTERRAAGEKSAETAAEKPGAPAVPAKPSAKQGFVSNGNKTVSAGAGTSMTRPDATRKPSPIAPPPSLGEAVPAYDSTRQKKEGSLLGIVGAMVGVAAVIGVAAGFWFLQGRFPGSESGQPAVVAQKSVPGPAAHAALDASGSGVVNRPASAENSDRSDAAWIDPMGDRTIPVQIGTKPAPAGESSAENAQDGEVMAKEELPVASPVEGQNKTQAEPRDATSDVQSAPVETGPAETAAVPTGRAYGVHVESFPTRKEAEEASLIYEAAGMPVTIKAVNVPGKGLWHRVVLGRVGSKAEADVLSREVKERFNLRYTLVVRVDR